MPCLIVRFRSANKKPIDIGFLFWVIINGIVLVVNLAGEEREDQVMTFIEKNVKKYAVKSGTVVGGHDMELSVEVRLKDMSTRFVNEISTIDGVSNAVLVSYNGDYMS